MVPKYLKIQNGNIWKFFWLLLRESCAFRVISVFGEGERQEYFYRLGALTHAKKFLT